MHQIPLVLKQMKLDEMQVVMLEIVKSAKMEHDENRHNLAIGPHAFGGPCPLNSEEAYFQFLLHISC